MLSGLNVKEIEQNHRINILGFDKTLIQWLIILIGPALYFLILALYSALKNHSF